MGLQRYVLAPTHSLSHATLTLRPPQKNPKSNNGITSLLSSGPIGLKISRNTRLDQLYQSIALLTSINDILSIDPYKNSFKIGHS